MRVRQTRSKISKKARQRTSLASSAVGLGVAALAVAPSADAATFTVTNLSDSGAGSLRQAIIDANTTGGADVVAFQAALSGTITLTTGQLYISDSVDIQGPGASVMTVSGNNSSRVFYMYSNATELDVRIAGLTITEGSETIGAGVINFDENLILDSVTITGNNSSGDGAGLWADGFNMDLTITNSTISGNISDEDGGGIYVEDTGGLLLIEDSVISGNQATGSGGGIYFYDPDDDIAIRNTTISGNTSGYLGGGVYLYSFDSGGLTIEGSTISGNEATYGGGLFLYSLDDTDSLIENSTISGNQATSGDGGGIYLYGLYGSNLTLNFVTLANNTATGSGGGMFAEIGGPAFTNSIIADNTAAVDNDLGEGADSSFDLTYSLLETDAGANISDLGNNLLGVDPQLGVLANNGGLTQTQRPALTSPVINAGDPATIVATDQRGQPREYPVIADMGAVELVGGVIQFNPTTDSVAESGPGSLTFTVVRDVGPDPATVDFTTNPGTATPGVGNDYTTTSGTLTFVAGDLSETFNVPILDDLAAEGNEQFTASLSNPSPDATIGAGNPATATITDDPTGTLQFSQATINTTEEAGSVTVTVTRVGGTEGALSANYSTAPGSATTPADYAAAAGSVNFAAGSAVSQTFNITLVDDAVSEGAEAFTANLTGASIGAPSTVTINLAASDAAVAAEVPTLSWWGRILLTIMSAFAGLYVIVRNRFSAFLIGMLFMGLFAAPQLTAARPHPGKAQATHAAQKKTEKPKKLAGTVQSVERTATTLVLTLTSGEVITVSKAVLNVADLRGAKRQRGTEQQIVVGSKITVKTRTGQDGNVKHVKIKIMG